MRPVPAENRAASTTLTVVGPTVTSPLEAIEEVALTDAMTDGLIAGQLSPRTRRAYASDIAELRKALEGWGVALPDVTKDHLHAFRAWLMGETVPGLPHRSAAYQPATIARKLSVCRQFFAEALDRGLIPRNPAANLKSVRVSDDSRTNGLTRTQAQDLLAAIETDTLPGLRDRAMLSLMLRTGLRRMDVLQATVGALVIVQGHAALRVVKSKGGKDRLVKIPVEVGRDLSAWRAATQEFRDERPATPLFCAIERATRRPGPVVYRLAGDGQKPLSEKAVWKIVQARARAAGLTIHISPHSTRHTFITLALDGGAPLHKVQVAAGHADPRTTERYWRTKQNLDDNAVDYLRL